jgi:hypothetical protein
VAEDWGYQEGSGDILLRLGDAFGQPRNRHETSVAQPSAPGRSPLAAGPAS